MKKKPNSLSLRISVTDRCQLRCRYCMPEAGVEWHSPEQIVSDGEIQRFIMLVQKKYDIRKLRLTGGDPLVRKNLSHLVRMLSGLNIPDISLTTNAQALAAQAPGLAAAGLKRVNISLDSLKADTYAGLTCGGSVQRALQGIRAARESGLTPVKLNMIVMRGTNDSEVESMLEFALTTGCELRFLELMPIGRTAQNHAACFVSSREVREKVQRLGTLTPLTGSCAQSSRNYLLETKHGVRGRIGFISSNSAPFCAGCRRLRFTCTGEIIGCLTSGDSRNIRPLLQDGIPNAAAKLAAEVEAALNDKQRTHTFAGRQPMIQVGG